MSLSNRTKSVIASSLVKNEDETYPDRTATDNTIRTDTTNGLLRIDKNVVPRVSEDMSKLYKWKKGASKLYGTHATRQEIGMNLYIKDILTAPDESSYQHRQMIIDTFKPIGPQLDEFK